MSQVLCWGLVYLNLSSLGNDGSVCMLATMNMTPWLMQDLHHKTTRLRIHSIGHGWCSQGGQNANLKSPDSNACSGPEDV